ncbi:hypothetical protein [Roseococcus pinisoli]|uniref:Uncharacterized protein n=1 Tax=Roseococcus pinisoli TaxID=2835040 RepID=A0ABS5QF77_9PROT|nr:hypothetical protein [Roseococcus pinisoli]MBS7812352.1 hypothetical protein [Roseococcus pinisoli]
MTETLSVRDKILEKLTDLFASIVEGQPVERPFPFQFSLVTRTPLTEESWKKAFSLGVHDTAEEEEEKADVIYCMLSVVLEWRATLSAGEKPSQRGNLITNWLKYRLYQDRTLGGLCINCVSHRNELYVEEAEQKRLSGAIFVRVLYRYRRGDPWLRV